MSPSHMAAATLTKATLVLLLLLIASPSSLSEAKLDYCKVVFMYLSPCMPYLIGVNDTVAASCCEGVNTLASGATNVEDKRRVCDCVQATAKLVHPKPENAINLPHKCGVNISFEISPSFNCSR